MPPSGVFGDGDAFAVGTLDGRTTADAPGDGEGVVLWHAPTTTATATRMATGFTE